MNEWNYLFIHFLSILLIINYLLSVVNIYRILYIYIRTNE